MRGEHILWESFSIWCVVFLGVFLCSCLKGGVNDNLVEEMGEVSTNCKDEYLNTQLKVQLVESDDDAICLYGEEGEFCCWNDEGMYRARLVSVTSFVMNMTHVCALDESDETACLNFRDQTNEWAFYGEYIFLAASDQKVYGVSKDNEIIEIIGRDQYPVTFVYSNDVNVADIVYFDAVFGRPFWITADNKFAYASTEDKEVGGRVTSLSCSYFTCCYVIGGVDVSCPVHCLSCGESLENRIDRIEVDLFNYCVLTDVGRIYCSNVEREEYFWSSNDDGYIDLAMRMNEMCAVRSNGQLQCWNLF